MGCYYMSERDQIIVRKILDYAKETLTFIGEYEYSDFMADRKTIAACAFAISQIGELSNSISDEARTSHTNIPWRSLRGMRNRIVHDYDHVDYMVMWSTLTQSIPELIEKLSAIISS